MSQSIASFELCGPSCPNVMHAPLHKRYTDIQEVGQGAYGTVLAATERASRTRVAVKIVPRKRPGTNKSFMRNIVREIELLRFMKHPNIVKFRGTFEDSDHVYITTEYCSGGDLMSYMISQRRVLGEIEALRLFAQVLEAVEYLHSCGIIHRDIKLENLVLDSGGDRAKLIDFGLCHWRRLDGKQFKFVGTSAYMAPELLAKVPHIPEQADMFSCGVLLHALLTRTLLFENGNVGEMEKTIMSFNAAELLLSPRLGHVSATTLSLLCDLLNQTPEKRPNPTEALQRVKEALRFAQETSISPMKSVEVGKGGKETNFNARNEYGHTRDGSTPDGSHSAAYLQRILNEKGLSDSATRATEKVKGLSDITRSEKVRQGMTTRTHVKRR